jgi:hypothetical protein
MVWQKCIGIKRNYLGIHMFLLIINIYSPLYNPHDLCIYFLVYVFKSNDIIKSNFVQIKT